MYGSILIRTYAYEANDIRVEQARRSFLILGVQLLGGHVYHEEFGDEVRSSLGRRHDLRRVIDLSWIWTRVVQVVHNDFLRVHLRVVLRESRFVENLSRGLMLLGRRRTRCSFCLKRKLLEQMQ